MTPPRPSWPTPPSTDDIFSDLKRLRGRQGVMGHWLMADHPALMSALRCTHPIEGYERLLRKLDDAGTLRRSGWAAARIFRVKANNIEDRLNTVASMAKDLFDLQEQPEARTIRRWSDAGLKRLAEELHRECLEPTSKLNPLRNVLAIDITGNWPDLRLSFMIGRHVEFSHDARVGFTWDREYDDHGRLWTELDMGRPIETDIDQDRSFEYQRYTGGIPLPEKPPTALALQVATSMVDAYRDVSVYAHLPPEFGVRFTNLHGIVLVHISMQPYAHRL